MYDVGRSTGRLESAIRLELGRVSFNPVVFDVRNAGAADSVEGGRGRYDSAVVDVCKGGRYASIRVGKSWDDPKVVDVRRVGLADAVGGSRS